MASVPKLPENKRSSSKLLKGPQEGTVRTDCCFFFFFFLSSAFPQAQLGTGTHFLLEWCEDEYPGYRTRHRWQLATREQKTVYTRTRHRLTNIK